MSPRPSWLVLSLLAPLATASAQLGQTPADPTGALPRPTVRPGALRAARPAATTTSTVTLRVRRTGAAPSSASPTSGPSPILAPDASFEVVVRGLSAAPEELVLLGEGERRVRAPRRSSSPEGAVYGPVRVAALAGPPPRGGLSYTAFKTTPSPDADAFQATLRQLAGRQPRALPTREVVFVRDVMGDPGRRDPGQAAPDVLGSDRSHPHLSGRELFEAGGVREVALTAAAPGGRELARGTLAVAGRASWMLFSGHYPAYGGGHLNGEAVFPTQVTGRRWPEHLRVLVFASCYALSVASPGVHRDAPSMGWQGAAWWRKFEGTVLGYRGVGPSGPVAAHITRRFLLKLSREDPDPARREEYSRTVARAWMWANTVRVAASDAAALDARGTYYYKVGGNSRVAPDPRIPSARRHPLGWREAPRDSWEGGARQNRQGWDRFVQLFQPLQAAWTEEQGGRPFSLTRARGHARWLEGTRRMGVDPSDPELLGQLRTWLAYQSHIYYDIFDGFVVADAVRWWTRTRGRPPTVAELRAHFTWPARSPRPRAYPGPDAISRVQDAELRRILEAAESWDTDQRDGGMGGTGPS